MNFQVWERNVVRFGRIVGEGNDELSVTRLFYYDRSGFECEICAIVTCQGDIVGSIDAVGGDGWMMRDLFGNELAGLFVSGRRVRSKEQFPENRIKRFLFAFRLMLVSTKLDYTVSFREEY